MLHQSTKHLIDRIGEMTQAGKLNDRWTEGPNGAVRLETGGYHLNLGSDPAIVVISTLDGKEVERADTDVLAATPHDSAGTYAAYIDQVHGHAARVARGAETAIETILGGLDLDGDGIPDIMADGTPIEDAATSTANLTGHDAGGDTLEDSAEQTGFGGSETDEVASQAAPEAEHSAQPTEDDAATEELNDPFRTPSPSVLGSAVANLADRVNDSVGAVTPPQPEAEFTGGDPSGDAPQGQTEDSSSDEQAASPAGLAGATAGFGTAAAGLAGTAAALASGRDQVAETAEDATGGIDDKIDAATDAVEEAASEVSDTLSGAAPQAGLPPVGTSEQPASEVSTSDVSATEPDTPSSSFGTIGGFGAAAGGLAGQAAETAQDTAAEITDTAADAAAETVGGVIGAASTTAETTLSGLGQAAEDAVDTSAELADQAGETAADTLSDGASSAGETLSTAASGAFGASVEQVSDAADTASEPLGEIKDAADPVTNPFASSPQAEVAGETSAPAPLPTPSDARKVIDATDDYVPGTNFGSPEPATPDVSETAPATDTASPADGAEASPQDAGETASDEETDPSLPKPGTRFNPWM